METMKGATGDSGEEHQHLLPWQQKLFFITTMVAYLPSILQSEDKGR